MGLIEEEIKEIRRDIKHYRAGLLTDKQVSSRVALYSQSEKRMRLFLTIFGMAAKHGKTHLNRVVSSGLIGNGTVIDMSPEEIEDEKVLCPISETVITRAKCLDFSGTAENIEKCGGCEVGKENKKLIVGNTPLYTA